MCRQRPAKGQSWKREVCSMRVEGLHPGMPAPLFCRPEGHHHARETPTHSQTQPGPPARGGWAASYACHAVHAMSALRRTAEELGKAGSPGFPWLSLAFLGKARVLPTSRCSTATKRHQSLMELIQNAHRILFSRSSTVWTFGWLTLV